jgi:membrane-associated protease RseP (regulator of RpoE activity)
MASMRFDRLASAACLLAAFLIASPVVAAPPGGAPPFHEWLFGRGRIGIRVQPLTPELREHFGAPSDRGVLVSEVESDRPAEKAGLRVGDVIVSVDGQAISKPGGLAGVLRRAPQGASLSIEVIRKGEALTLEVEPDDPTPLIDQETQEWMEGFGRHLEKGGRHLERRLEELERRMEELQREFEERMRDLDDGDAQKT